MYIRTRYLAGLHLSRGDVEISIPLLEKFLGLKRTKPNENIIEKEREQIVFVESMLGEEYFKCSKYGECLLTSCVYHLARLLT